ncbi:type II toxin-antitoxin system RelE/ParE family toxin [Streptosporangium canum]|uniref:type II toxin-antitoxin system RelE/ParE family toxin n=1 Tax=Streptosporangium canum TaxID=324952 RepID=UPI0036C2A623
MARRSACGIVCEGGFLCRSADDGGPSAGEPYTKQLDGKLRGLRFHLDEFAVRITYWIATGRRIVLLTVFHKTRTRDDHGVERARRAMRRCAEPAHTVDEGEVI